MLVDTSAWIEWLRGTDSEADRVLGAALERGDRVCVAGVVVQEVLQGARSEVHAAEIRALLGACEALEAVYPETYEHAASLYRRCRATGRAVRGTVDCLIAAIALERNLDVLATDRDFSTLSEVCGLRLVLRG